MKIKKLVVKNYKVFDHLELDFTDSNGQVLDTIVFAGLNGSGKTTILELLTDLINGSEPRSYLKPETEIELEILINKEVYGGSHFPRYSFKDYYFIDFHSYSTKYDVLVFQYKDKNKSLRCFKDLGDAISGILSESHRVFKIELTTRIEQAIYIMSNDKPNLREAVKNTVSLSFTTDNSFARNRIVESVRNDVFKNPDERPRTIYNQYVYELNKIFDNLKIASKLIEVGAEGLVFKSSNGHKIDFEDLSSGEKMLYFIGFTLSQLNPIEALIMIDQPEDSLHPTWQQEAVKFFQNIGKDSQIMLATHSPQILASVKPESLFVLGVNSETKRIEAFNMAKAGKHTRGVDANRILSEIMGTPVRDYETQQRINTTNDLLRAAEIDPSVLNLEKVEKMVAELTEDFGKQDAAIMRLNNEIRLLKRKMAVIA